MIKKIIKNISNIPGWRTNRKIVVIESDDWGSIRMPSKNAYNNLLENGLSMGEGSGARYNMFDTLADSDDLNALFEVLTNVKDFKGNFAKFTALSLVANPDFDKIKDNNFNCYYYETFSKTLERYKKHGAFEMWQEGIKAGVFIPEFHGREHLNIQVWLRALQIGDKEAILAFEQGLWGYDRKRDVGFQAAFDLEFASDLDHQKQIIKEGLELFKKLHGYKANFFVPPNGPINNQLEKTAVENGINFMSSPKLQKETLGEGKTKTHFRYLGKKNKHGQIYITRNAFFEPSEKNEDTVNTCLKQIEIAFEYKKPAIISSHRVNYIGGLVESNRINGLIQLEILLKKIIKYWPNVEFMSSCALGLEIEKSRYAK